MPKPFSVQDHYFHQAKKRGLRARSAFKLEEILQKFPQLLSQGDTVIDLGAAPGSFLQILGEYVGREGKVVGIDLQTVQEFVQFPAKLHLIQGDIFSAQTEQKLQKIFPKKIDLVTSDMAPKTSGIRDADQWKSVELNQRVLELCEKFLKPGGNLIAKIFVGADFQEFWKEEFQPCFQKSKTYKPMATRDRSFETYLIGIGWKGR